MTTPPAASSIAPPPLANFPIVDLKTGCASNTFRQFIQTLWTATQPAPVKVAGLPSPMAGLRGFVTDSTVAASGNFGAVVAGGGGNGVPVFATGSQWLIG